MLRNRLGPPKLRSWTFSQTNVLLIAFFGILLAPQPALAYIGPGAGLVIVSSFFAIFWALVVAFLTLFTWPLRSLIRVIRGFYSFSRSPVKRLIILGLDGMDPTLAEKYMAEGKLPHLVQLSKQGCFKRLATTLPALSPVAWSTFLTGSNPGKHNIYDFLRRDKGTYQPRFSSIDMSQPEVKCKIGKFTIPFTRSKPYIRLLRKGKPFWYYLGQHGIFSNIIRVPITFPPEKFHGVLLSGMGVPDLRGSQGTFFLYTTRQISQADLTDGTLIKVKREDHIIQTDLIGPANPNHQDKIPLKSCFTIKIQKKDRSCYDAILRIDGDSYHLQKGVYSDWIPVSFKAGQGKKVRGICQMLLKCTEPEFELYVSPIHIDPEKPVMPISQPAIYSIYLSKRRGRFATLGLAEDTWALNTKVLDEEEFLEQCRQFQQERQEMLLDALAKVKKGLCVCVFDGLDRVQHMFWRYLEKQKPANQSHTANNYSNVIEQWYQHMDELVGLVGRKIALEKDKQTVLMVVSNHGFNSFRYGVDLNRWLEENGYLKLIENGRSNQYLSGIDWTNTRAFALGLAGIYLNLKGREAQGIVDPDAEATALRMELIEKLTGLTDPIRGQPAILQIYDSHQIYHGPYVEEAPDLIVGYNTGYRAAWEMAVGQVTEKVFHENTKAWSGDHGIDLSLVPGVFFCNRQVASDRPHIMDIGPTVLAQFGIPVPKHMDGQPLQLIVKETKKKKSKKNPRESVSEVPIGMS